MLKNEVIREVSTNPEYKRICKKMCNGLGDDLFQELILILLEYDEKKFFKIKDITNAKFFIVGILCNMVHSTTSPFYYKYKKINYYEQQPEQTDDENEIDYAKVEKILQDEHWFDKELLTLYANYGSYRKVEQQTGIDHTFVYRTVHGIKKRIKEKMEPLNILLVVQKNTTALQYHRQLIPHERLLVTNPEIKVTQVLGGVNNAGKGYEATVDNIPDDELAKFNIVYYLRQVSYQNGKAVSTIKRLHELGCKVILDIDDYWRLPPNHYYYQQYKDEKVAEEVTYTLQNVDYVVTTTDYFADKIRPYNKNIAVIPNCISPDDKQFIPREIESQRVRFGWIGGVHHKEDIAQINGNFCKLHKQTDKQLRDNWQLCLGGFNPNPEYNMIETYLTCNYDFKYTDATYYEYLRQYTPASEHISYDKPYRRLWGRDIYNYGQLYNEIDVALVPIADNSFNKCKSELKIVEAGWMKKAVIVSDIPPYSKWINSDNGIKVKPVRNNIDWYLAMRKMTLDKDMRTDIAEALHETIKENFDIDKHNKNRLSLYKSLQ